jgi:CRP-like cAMP-binding protein/thioredoxin reductase/Fe-S-cluster-containing hydrogenase component 2
MVRDLVIVGTGPAGLACASHAQANGLDYLALERSDHLADTIFNYQARKFVMAEPSPVPKRGDLPFGAGSRESILAGWQSHAAQRALNVEFNADVRSIERRNGTLIAGTAAGSTFEARNVVLAMGTQGNPRKLGVPGEDRTHVRYRLSDPDEHRDQDILVIGGGDSAMEIAISLSDHNRVGLVVIEPEITYANAVLTQEALSRQAAGRMTIHFSARVKDVFEGEADLEVRGEIVRVPAELIFVKIGAEPPRSFFESIGIAYGGTDRGARPVLSAVHESSVPGVFLIGAAAGRDLIKLGINQGYEVVEHLMGREVVPADEEILRQRLPFWTGSVRERIEAIRASVPLLGAADATLVRDVFLSARVRECADGETITRQNDYSSELLVVTSGRVGLFRTAEGSKEEKKLVDVNAGDFFGEGSLISGRRRQATARAAGTARLIELPRKPVLKLLANSPQARALVDETLLRRYLGSYLLPGVAPGAIADLTAQATVEKMRKGAVIYREGEDADSFYLIRNGMVKLSRQSQGKERVLSYFTAGKFFGESALLSDGKRTATVTAIFPCELVKLSKEAVSAFVRREPAAGELLRQRREERWAAGLVAEATPVVGEILGELIGEEVVMGTQALLIDQFRCIRCGNCISACQSVHDDGQARLSLTGIRVANLLAPNSCWHCENPLCMLDCPPDAITRDPRGEIYIRSNCIGCGNCARNCPYGNIFMVHKEPEFSLRSWIGGLFGGKTEAPAADQSVAVKCDLCRDLSGGPACVRSCPTGAAIRLGPEEFRDTFGVVVNR